MAAFGLPPGFRFLPTDQELVASYLMKKLMGTLSPVEATLIPECDLYGKEEPWQLFERLGSQLYGDDIYLFTKLKKKISKGSRIVRSVGVSGGSWHGEDSGKKIVAEVNTEGQCGYVEAVKKRYSYRNRGSKENCGWIMHEYCLAELGSEWAVCRLRKNESSAGDRVSCKKRKAELKNAEFELVNSDSQITNVGDGDGDEGIDDFILSLLNI